MHYIGSVRECKEKCGRAVERCLSVAGSNRPYNFAEVGDEVLSKSVS